MKSKSQLVREFLKGLGKRIVKLDTLKDQWIAECRDSFITGHINGENIYLDGEVAK